MSCVFVFIVKRVLKKIKPDSKRRKWLMDAKQVLKGNPEIGDKISPKRTPRYYKKNMECFLYSVIQHQNPIG